MSRIGYESTGSDRFAVTFDGEPIGQVWHDGVGWLAVTVAGTHVLPVMGDPRWLTQSGAGLALTCFVLDVKGR